MIISEADINLLDKYFPEYFSLSGIWKDDIMIPYCDLTITQIQFNELKKFAKKNLVQTHINNLAGIFSCCITKLDEAKIIEQTKPFVEEMVKEKFQMAKVFSSELTKVTFESANGKAIIVHKINLFRLQSNLLLPFEIPAKNKRSYTKSTKINSELRIVLKVLIELFTNEIPLKHKKKNELYKHIHDFLKIDKDYFEGNSAYAPEEKIKRLLQN